LVRRAGRGEYEMNEMNEMLENIYLAFGRMGFGTKLKPATRPTLILFAPVEARGWGC